MINRLFNLDKKILIWLNHFSQDGSILKFLIKIFSECSIYVGVIVIVILWFWQKSAKKVVLKTFFSGLISWQIFARLVGHFINRQRPFDLENVKELIFHRPTYSFPSDHAAALFAVCFTLWFCGYKKMSIFFVVLTLLMSVARVAAGLHWPSDILGGIIFGFVTALILKLLDKQLDPVYNFLIRIAQKLKLA